MRYKNFKVYTALVSLFIVQVGYCQPGPPPMIVIKSQNYSEITALANYFNIFAYEVSNFDSLPSPKLLEPLGNRFIQTFSDSTHCFSLCIAKLLPDGTVLCGRPQGSAIVVVNIAPKLYPDFKMCIYFRIREGLGYNDQIVITRPNFMQGFFFYDMCKSSGLHETIQGEEIDMTYIASNLITLKKLDSLVSKNPCH